jgi:hypothetical protein
MLVCVNASGEALCPLIVTTNSATLGVFQGGVQEGVDLKIRVNSSSYVNADIFRDYIRDYFIPHVENHRTIHGKQGSPAVLLMDNCSAHLRDDIIEMLSLHRIKIITFPPHTSGIFQMLDRVLFGVFKTAMRGQIKDPQLHFMTDHARRMLRAFETAKCASNIRASFLSTGFIYEVDASHMYTLGYDEAKVRHSSEFSEVGNVNYPIEAFTKRRLATRWGFLNQAAFEN